MVYWACQNAFLCVSNVTDASTETKRMHILWCFNVNKAHPTIQPIVSIPYIYVYVRWIASSTEYVYMGSQREEESAPRSYTKT